MKNFNISQFLGCCVIGASIIVAGWLISKEMPDTTQVPSNLSVTQEERIGKYLSMYEAAVYLSISEDDVDELLKDGELEGTYFVVGENYTFSHEKLDEWVEERLR